MTMMMMMMMGAGFDVKLMPTQQRLHMRRDERRRNNSQCKDKVQLVLAKDGDKILGGVLLELCYVATNSNSVE